MTTHVLKNIEEINEQFVSHNRQPKDFIHIDHKKNTITFKLQNGPRQEVGVNGCQVEDIIATAKLIIEKFNESHPCEENYRVCGLLGYALEWSKKRTKNRLARGVEGTNAV